MALTAEQLKKYSLSKSDAKSSDHDKGIVEVQGKFYSIDGFERQQRDDIDTDQGKVFSSSLEKDSGKDFTNFNTATDVEGALNSLFEDKEEAPTVEKGPIELSERLATARARTKQFEADRISGQAAADLYDSENNPASGFLDRYKLRLGKKLENGRYLEPDASTSTNSSTVASGANDVSVDTAEYSRTGIDNRKGY